MGEWMFIIICLISIFFAAQRLKEHAITKTEIILSFVAYIFLTALFLTSLTDQFTYRKLIIFCLFEVIALFNFNEKFQNYKRGHPQTP